MHNRKALKVISVTLLTLYLISLSGCSGIKIKSIETYEQIDNKADNYDKNNINIILDEQNDKEISYKN